MLTSTCGSEYQQPKEHSTGIANLLLRGTALEEIRLLLYGANLFASGKKDGGVRLIAVGFKIRRMVAKIVNKRIKHLNDMFRPIQLGFATPRGVEAAVHAACSFIESKVFETSPRVIMKVEGRNSYNSVDRQSHLEAVEENIPGYYPFIFRTYGMPSYLLYNQDVILSQKGLQQGHPFGPVDYYLTTAVAHKNLRWAMV